MNREQKEVLSLLTEIDEICRKHGIVYYLSPQLTLCGMKGMAFPQNPSAGTVYMKIPDMEKFRKAAEEEAPARRIVESMRNSRRFPGFFLHYVNMDTLHFDLNEGRNFKYAGIHVKILPLRGKIPSRLQHLWNRGEEAGWIQLSDAYTNKAGKKKRLCGLFMGVRCLTGRGRLGKSLYRHFCSRQDVSETPEYVLRLKKKTVYFPKHIFDSTVPVTLCGKTFQAPADLNGYLRKYYGADYLNKTFGKYMPKAAEMVSARVSFEDYFRETGKPSALVRARMRQRKRDTFGKNRKKYLESCWKYVKFCGLKIQLEEYYIQKKDYIENLYKNKDYPALEEIFRPYHRATLKSLKSEEIFVPDEEVFEIYLQVLEKTGKTALKERVEKYWR